MRVTLPALSLCVVLALSAACASRRPSAAAGSAPDFVRAVGLIEEGCYACLEEALTLVQPLAGTSVRARATTFEAALLLAGRDRELGMRAVDHLPLARSVAPTGDERSRVLLEIVEAMPWPPAANGPEERDRALVGWRALESVVPRWHSFLAGRPPTDIASRYFLVAVQCTWSHLLPEPAQTANDAPRPQTTPTSDAGEPSVLRFRRALCDRPPLDQIVALQSEMPRYTELDLLAGDEAMNGGALLTAERHYQAAYRTFPTMLPAAHGLARLHVMLEEYETSLPEYDAVLAVVPDQQDCLLGKARALSQLGRHADAIALLDRLISLGTWLIGDAHCWRGWNRLQLVDVEGAAADAERALALMVNARVHVLAGAVAARRNEWDRARREFEEAHALDETDCDIPVSLGAVRGQLKDWGSAFDSYARAATCLVDAQKQVIRRVAEITSAQMDEPRRERMLARARRSADAALRQEGQSRYNAAVSLLNAGRATEARPWAEQATNWPEWKDRATALLAGSR